MSESKKPSPVSVALSLYSDEELLRELVFRNEIYPAPTSTVRTREFKEVLIGLGKDESASIIMHNDGLAYLRGENVE